MALEKDPIEKAKGIWALIIFVGAVGGVLFSVFVLGWPAEDTFTEFAALVGVGVAVLVAFLIDFIRVMRKG